MTPEQAIADIQEDELAEVTPKRGADQEAVSGPA
jgi:hypothetical protein